MPLVINSLGARHTQTYIQTSAPKQLKKPGMHRPAHAWFNNCTSNSQVIARGKAEYIFDWYKYNYYLIACKYMWLPTNHIALPMTLHPYP